MRNLALNACKALCLALVAALASCGKDYYDVIPQKSPAVAEIDLAGVASEGGAGLGDLFRRMPFGPGVDFSQPAYAFVTPGGYYGIVFAVDDEDEIAKSVAASKAITQRSEEWGLNWAAWHGAWQLAWNDKALVVIGPVVETGREALRTMVVAMFGSSEGVSKGDLFAKLGEIDGSAKIVARLSAVPEFLGRLIALPIDEDGDSVIVKAAVSFGDGDVAVRNEIERNDGGAPRPSPVVRPYGGTLDGRVFQGDVLAVVLTGLDGAALSRRVGGDRELRAMLSSAGGAKLLADVPRIDGDAAICPFVAHGRDGVSLSVVATVRDTGGGAAAKSVRTYMPPEIAVSSVGMRLDTVSVRPRGLLCYAEIMSGKLAGLPVVAGIQDGGIAKLLRRYGRVVYQARDASHSELHFYGSNNGEAYNKKAGGKLK